MKKFLLPFLYLIALHLTLSANPIDYLPDEVFEKDSVVILVTDSGLGGLSIAADLLERLKVANIFMSINVIFFNAQPHLKSGYNSMKTTEEKVEVFNNALNSMEKNFKPDVILIGCNTLSVIYEFTEFSKYTSIPVIGIVEAGVELIKKNIADLLKTKVVIFGTETTIEQAKHKKMLVEKGIDSSRIFLVPCSKLAGNIERDTDSRLTDSLVNAYVADAINLLGEEDELFVSYNCTHYGYVDNKFQDAFNKAQKKVKGFLNPNPFMNDVFFNDAFYNRFESTTATIKVVSQAELTPGKIGSIYTLIEPLSEDAANALFDYQFEPDFFEWKSITNFVEE